MACSWWRSKFVKNKNIHFMINTRNMVHPNFMIGMLSNVILIAGIVFTQMGIEWRRSVVLISFLLLGIHWVWSIINVWKDKELKGKDAGNSFWLSLVIMIPPLA